MKHGRIICLKYAFSARHLGAQGEPETVNSWVSLTFDELCVEKYFA